MVVQVFVAGATGNTGKRVVQQLSAKGIKVLAGTRVRIHSLPDLQTCHPVSSNGPNIKYNLAKAVTCLHRHNGNAHVAYCILDTFKFQL